MGRRGEGDTPRSMTARGSPAPAVVLAVLASLLFLTSSAVAAPLTAAFPGAKSLPTLNYRSFGCAQTHEHGARWSAYTGNGSLRGSTVARTCPTFKGGAAAPSYGEVSEELALTVPVHLTTGAGGVNVSWDLRIFGNESATFLTPTTTCPPSGSYSYGGRTVSFYSCVAEAFVNIGAYAELEDVTNASYFVASNSWSGISSESGVLNYTTLNWSNPFASTTFNGSVGTPARFSGHYAPQFFINGTFVGSDTYELLIYLYTDQISEVQGYTGGSAVAHTQIDLAGTAGHADLRPIATW